MALTSQQIAERLLKKTSGVIDSNFPLTVKGITEEGTSTYNLVTPNAIWSQADQIPTTPPVLSNLGESGVVKYYEKLELVREDAGTNVAFKSPLGQFKNAISGKFGFGYNFKIYGGGAGATQIFLGDWLVDAEAGVITFYNAGATEATINGTNPPYVTFYKYIGQTGLTAVTGDISSLSTALSSEISGRTSGETSLSTALSTEVSLRTSVDVSLSSSSLQPWIDIDRSGFVNNAETSINFNAGTRVFTLTGTTWSYYRSGIKHTITGNKTITLPSTAGTYYITIDSTTGDLISGTTVWTISEPAISVVSIRYNSANTPVYFMADERHTIAIDKKMHQYLHQTRGTQFISGGALTGPTLNGTSNFDNTFGVAQTVIADEDLYFTLSPLTRPDGATPAYNIFNRIGASTWTWTETALPFITGTTYIKWDDNGTMQEGIDAKFYNTYLLYSDQNSTGRFSTVHGRGQYNSLSEAQAENPLNFDWSGLPIAESVIAYQFTWGTNSTLSTKGKVALVANPVKINISTTTIVASGAGTDHDTLSGLDGGTSNEYYHLTYADYVVATGISVTVSSEVSTRLSVDNSLSSALSSAISAEGSLRTSGDTSLTSALSSAISSEASTRLSTDATKLNLSGGVMTGSIDMTNNFIVVSGSPTSDYHVANKAYVDAMAQGVSPHAPVRVVSISNIASISGLLTIDGVTLINGDSVLLAGQTDKRENGIFTATGTTWSRRTDADGDPDNEIELGDFVFVESGSTNASSGWVLGKTDSSDMPITPDVDTEEWYKMAAPGSYTTDGEGLDLNGNIFSLELSGNTLEKSSFGLRLADALSQTISSNTTSISTEVSDRVVADNSLSTVISTEVSNRTSGDTSLTTALSTEGSLRTSGDTSLTLALSSEASTRTSVDNSISIALSTEISDRAVADNSLSTVISTEASLRTSGDTSLTSALSTEASLRTSTDTSLTTRVSTEESDRVVADNSLSTSISTEVSDRASGDTSLSTALSTEASLRESGDTSLSIAVNSNVSSSISTEASTRESADTSLTTRISNEESNRTSADTSLTTRISNETSDRVSGDTSLSIALSAEGSLRTSGDTSLTSALSTEASVRISTDSSLSTSLSTEGSLRTSGDTSLSIALSTEASLRLSGDTSLSAAIANVDDITANLSQGQIVFYSGTTLSGMTNLFPSLSTALSTEASIRTSGDTSLSIAINSNVSGSISTEASLRLSGDTSLSTALSTEASLRSSGITSLSVEISSFVSMNEYDDTSLSTAVSTEISDRTSGDTSLSTVISTEASLRISGDTSLSIAVNSNVSSSISTEASLRESGDTSLSTALSTEASVRISTDSSLSTALSTEGSLRTSGDTSISTSITQLGGSGLTYSGGKLNVVVDDLTIGLSGNTLIGTRPWLQVTGITTVGVTAVTFTLQYEPVAPISAYINGVEYLVRLGVAASTTNYPFYCSVEIPVVETNVIFDPAFAGFDLDANVDVVVIKYLTLYK